jgi:hypothetical protein
MLIGSVIDIFGLRAVRSPPMLCAGLRPIAAVFTE